MLALTRPGRQLQAPALCRLPPGHVARQRAATASPMVSACTATHSAAAVARPERARRSVRQRARPRTCSAGTSRAKRAGRAGRPGGGAPARTQACWPAPAPAPAGTRPARPPGCTCRPRTRTPAARPGAWAAPGTQWSRSPGRAPQARSAARGASWVQGMGRVRVQVQAGGRGWRAGRPLRARAPQGARRAGRGRAGAGGARAGRFAGARGAAARRRGPAARRGAHRLRHAVVVRRELVARVAERAGPELGPEVHARVRVEHRRARLAQDRLILRDLRARRGRGRRFRTTYKCACRAAAPLRARPRRRGCNGARARPRHRSRGWRAAGPAPGAVVARAVCQLSLPASREVRAGRPRAIERATGADVCRAAYTQRCFGASVGRQARACSRLQAPQLLVRRVQRGERDDALRSLDPAVGPDVPGQAQAIALLQLREVCHPLAGSPALAATCL